MMKERRGKKRKRRMKLANGEKAEGEQDEVKMGMWIQYYLMKF